MDQLLHEIGVAACGAAYTTADLSRFLVTKGVFIPADVLEGAAKRRRRKGPPPVVRRTPPPRPIPPNVDGLLFDYCVNVFTPLDMNDLQYDFDVNAAEIRNNQPKNARFTFPLHQLRPQPHAIDQAVQVSTCELTESTGVLTLPGAKEMLNSRRDLEEKPDTFTLVVALTETPVRVEFAVKLAERDNVLLRMSVEKMLPVPDRFILSDSQQVPVQFNQGILFDSRIPFRLPAFDKNASGPALIQRFRVKKD